MRPRQTSPAGSPRVRVRCSYPSTIPVFRLLDLAYRNLLTIKKCSTYQVYKRRDITHSRLWELSHSGLATAVGMKTLGALPFVMISPGLKNKTPALRETVTSLYIARIFPVQGMRYPESPGPALDRHRSVPAVRSKRIYMEM